MVKLVTEFVPVPVPMLQSGELIVMLPEVGKWKPQIAFMIVVFPEPLGPRSPVIEPSAIVSETSSAAGADFEE